MDDTTVKHHSEFVEKLLVYQSTSSIVQFIVDVIIEMLIVAGIMEYQFAFRTEYIMMAFLTSFFSFKTLDSIRKDDFGLVHEDIQGTMILEVSLVISDFWFLWGLDHLDMFWIRLPFIVLTTINGFIIHYIICKYKLWSLFYRGEYRATVEHTNADGQV